MSVRKGPIGPTGRTTSRGRSPSETLRKGGGAVGVFIVLVGLVALGIILLAPIMLPGAIVVFIVIGLIALVRRHHTPPSVVSH